MRLELDLGQGCQSRTGNVKLDEVELTPMQGRKVCKHLPIGTLRFCFALQIHKTSLMVNGLFEAHYVAGPGQTG